MNLCLQSRGLFVKVGESNAVGQKEKLRNIRLNFEFSPKDCLKPEVRGYMWLDIGKGGDNCWLCILSHSPSLGPRESSEQRNETSPATCGILLSDFIDSILPLPELAFLSLTRQAFFPPAHTTVLLTTCSLYFYSFFLVYHFFCSLWPSLKIS